MYVGVKNGKGFTSQRKRIFFICLDSKARLVLPLEIREALNIEKKGKILINVMNGDQPSAVSNGSKTQDPRPKTIIVQISVASDSDVANSISFSKNGKYLRGEKYEK